LPAGPVAEVAALERLLAACWDDLRGDDGGMAGTKLVSRTEAAVWSPPVLRFRIERHGGTVQGSSRAELQHWEVDAERGTATLVKTGRRQLRPMAARVNVGRVAGEVAAAVRTGRADRRLTWVDRDEVIVRPSAAFPPGSAVKLTLAGRRKRFREAVGKLLLDEGWEMVGRDRFRRSTNPA
jgi:hypothetical protein